MVRNTMAMALITVSLLAGAGCSSPEGKTVAEQKAYTLKTRDEAMHELYTREPTAKAKLEAAPGYVFLSCFAAHPGILTFANGYGIVQNNKTGKATQVRMKRFGIGPGLAVKGYYFVATLGSDEQVKAVEQGKWTGGGIAEASFKFGGTGGTAVAESHGGMPDTWIWTHTGVALELAAVYGGVSPDEDLK